MKSIESFTKRLPKIDPFNRKKVRELGQQVKDLALENDRMLEMVIKPDYIVNAFEKGIQPVILPIQIQDLYSIAMYNSVIRTITINIKGEIFRKPPMWTPRFKWKCKSCGNEHAGDVETCDVCGSDVLQAPDVSQLKRFESSWNEANKNEQTMIEVFKQCEEDLEVVDDCWLILIKEYIAGDDGILFERVKEIVRGDPNVMRFVANEKGEIGGKWWVCPFHRYPEIKSEDDDHERELERIYKDPGHCPECGRKLEEVYYVSIRGGDNSSAPEQFFFKGEIIHASKYSPSLLYGKSPIVSIWKEGSTLLNMSNYVNEYYRHMRTPKGAMFCTTMNPESMYKKWDEIQERIKVDPHYVPMLALQGDSNSKNQVSYVKFADTLQEMGYEPSKNELRQRISAVYGVTNILMNDTTGSGGMNNEGLQIKVTDRAIEIGQSVWNLKIFPKLLAAFGVSDWDLMLQPAEETDRMKKVQMKTAEAQLAQIMQQMGFKVELDDNDNFLFSGEATDIQEMMQQQQEGAIPEGLEEGEVEAGEEPEEGAKDLNDYKDEGGSPDSSEYFLDEGEDANKGIEYLMLGNGSIIELDDELKKIMPYQRSLANGYRKVEITRRDGQRQVIWKKAFSDEEMGKKRTGNPDDVKRDRLNFQRRPGRQIKREGYNSIADRTNNLQIEGNLDPESIKHLNLFAKKHPKSKINVVDNKKSEVQDLMQGHKAAYNPKTKELSLANDLSSEQMKKILRMYHSKINELDAGDNSARQQQQRSKTKK